MTDAASVPQDAERSNTLWFAALLTLTNGFLDAHTYIARGHVFANVQTANVIFSAIDVSERHFSAALAHVWPLLAFISGMMLASHIKSGRVEQVVPHSLRWTSGSRRSCWRSSASCPRRWTTTSSRCRSRSSPPCRSVCSAGSGTWPTCPSPPPAI